jgi:hypothetical protein
MVTIGRVIGRLHTPHARARASTVRSLTKKILPSLFTRAIAAPTPLPNAQRQGAATTGGTGPREGGLAPWPAGAAAARRVAARSIYDRLPTLHTTAARG